MKKFRTADEQEVGRNIERIFTTCPDSVEIKLENFTKYVRRQHLKRFLALYEIFKLILPVKGSIVECGVFRGFGLMGWAKLSTMLEPEDLTRRIYGFDSFAGFPSASEKDDNPVAAPTPGGLRADSYDELLALVDEYDRDRFLGHIPKVHLIKGDVTQTIPKFIVDEPHVVVSLLFLDLDLYEPTKVAIESFLPRMPKGAVIAFDELDNPMWPGETLALLESIGINRLRLQRFDWDPYISFAVLE
ncbi:MAG TPA: dTDP-6-deoxy-L-hexose 3-O-methyltransferase [Blastocatellia bacterium]|nr:dTDP-6-deoxy-L-hexose 3-O-methyltransferase [Blastocatellia bacterium]